VQTYLPHLFSVFVVCVLTFLEVERQNLNYRMYFAITGDIMVIAAQWCNYNKLFKALIFVFMKVSYST
jgi:hypothetical protein